MVSPRIQLNVPARKEWAIAPDGGLDRVSMAPNCQGPLQYGVTNGELDYNIILVIGAYGQKGWAAVKDNLSESDYADFMKFQALCDQWARKTKPADFPKTDPAFGVPVHLIPDLCTERRSAAASVAAIPKPPSPGHVEVPDGEPDDTWKVKELRAYAKLNGIKLSATRGADILEEILEGGED